MARSAERYLKQLSGRTHEVWGGIALREGEQVAASILGGGSGGVDLRLSMGREFYEEEGELAAGHAVHAHVALEAGAKLDEVALRRRRAPRDGP